MPLFTPACLGVRIAVTARFTSYRGPAINMVQKTMDTFLAKRPRLSGPQPSQPMATAASSPQSDAPTINAGASSSAAAAAVAAAPGAQPQEVAHESAAVPAAAPAGEAQAPAEDESGAPTAAVGGNAATAQQQVTEFQRLRAHANRNAALAKQAVIACERSGTLPSLESLLVEESWKELLGEEFSKPYFKDLERFVQSEWGGGKMVFPPKDSVFRAFNSCPVDQIKVVILGQDPYHDLGQAMGLSFSVPQGKSIPSSLRNIYKELKQDLGCSISSHGNLEKWAQQGVLLLNAVLTVRAHQAGSHAKKGWEKFTEAAISKLSQRRSGLVFLLWGRFAQDKTKVICPNKHHILTAAHPSGLSANRGFFGCRHFSQANALLQAEGQLPIDWQIE